MSLSEDMMFSKLNLLAVILLTSLLAACNSSMPPRQSSPSQPPAANTPTTADKPYPSNSPSTPSAPSTMGPRVINIDPKPETDGNPTDGIDPNIPLETSVTPKVEPIVKSTTKPYIVNGETVSPMLAVATPFTQIGHASWYGKKFHGRKTASGEPYDMYKLSAAHRTLPIPSYVRVTNLSNKKSLIVRVNDRGPFGRPRIIDLSYAAAKQLDIIQHGSTQVQIELIDPSLPTDSVQTTSKDNVQPVAVTTQTAPSAGPPTLLETNGTYVQVGAFGQEENADRLQQRIVKAAPETQSLLNKVYNGKLFQVVLGPYPDHALAAQAASQMRDQLQLPALIFSR
jgi:rare lipoprotein A